MTTIDPAALTPELLRGLLTEWASGYLSDEAAVALLTRGCGGLWLRRRDFLRACVDVLAHGRTTYRPDGIDHLESAAGNPTAAIRWEDVPRFLDTGVPASSEEVNLLRAAASVAGVGGPSIGSIHSVTAGLDAEALALVLDAIAHRAGWHEHDLTHTVTGRLRPPGLDTANR